MTVQNFVEFWAVATRPAGSENGLGMTTETATNELAVLIDLFPPLPEPVSIFDEWQQLVTRYRVSGKSTHDARLVAAMKAHGIGKILTFKDFGRYKEIEAITSGGVGALVGRLPPFPFPDNPVDFISSKLRYGGNRNHDGG